MPNTPAFVTCYYGALKVGAIPVPFHAASPGPEVAFFLEDSGAATLVAAESDPPPPRSTGSPRPRVPVASSVDAPWDAAVDSPALRLADVSSMACDELGSAPTRPEDTAVMLYTSGTTGRPKGAMLTHSNVIFFSQLLARDLWQLRADDVMLMAAQAARTSSGRRILNVACAAGAALHLLPRFDVSAFLNAIDAEGIAFFAGVPALAQQLLRAPLVAGRSLGSVRLVMLGGIARSIRRCFEPSGNGLACRSSPASA